MVGIISKREAENVKRAIDFSNKKSAEIKLMNDQIRVLDEISDNDVIRPIIDDLRTKRAKEVAYTKMFVFGESAPVEHDVEYYKNNLKHYCNKYRLYIADFELDTGMRACVDDYIDEVQGYTY